MNLPFLQCDLTLSQPSRIKAVMRCKGHSDARKRVTAKRIQARQKGHLRPNEIMKEWAGELTDTHD